MNRIRRRIRRRPRAIAKALVIQGFSPFVETALTVSVDALITSGRE
jgi:hypothetical protein